MFSSENLYIYYWWPEYWYIKNLANLFSNYAVTIKTIFLNINLKSFVWKNYCIYSNENLEMYYLRLKYWSTLTLINLVKSIQKIQNCHFTVYCNSIRKLCSVKKITFQPYNYVKFDINHIVWCCFTKKYLNKVKYFVSTV